MGYEFAGVDLGAFGWAVVVDVVGVVVGCVGVVVGAGVDWE